MKCSDKRYGFWLSAIPYAGGTPWCFRIAWVFIALLGAGLGAKTCAAQAPEDLTKLDLATLQQRASAGNAQAQVALAGRFASGTGIGKDDSQYVFWIRKAAGQGYAPAESLLGWACASGAHGVVKDQSQAISWYRKAADQGDVSAERNLAVAYLLGQGVPKDKAQSDVWYGKLAAQYRVLAEQGDLSAESDLAFAYLLGQGVPKDKAQSDFWYGKLAAQYRVLAEQGDKEAQYQLGNVYEHGYGVPRDPAQARIWYQKSAEQGYSSGVSALKRLDGETRLAASLPVVPQPSSELLELIEAKSSQNKSGPSVIEELEQCQGAGVTAALQCWNVSQATDRASTPQLDPKLASEAMYFRQAAAARGCGLGLVYACAEYGRAVWDAGDREGAKRVWAAGPCTGVALCSQVQALSEKARIDDEQLEIKRQADQERWDQHMAELRAKDNQPKICLFCQFVDALAPLTANMDPNAIENAKNQQVRNLQARQAQIQTAQAATMQEQQTAIRLAAQQQNGQTQVIARQSADSGIAAAPHPAATSVATLDVLCPASGFVPGVMTHPSSDVALGVPCKPGAAIYINGVAQFDATGTGTGSLGSGNGGVSANSTDGPSEAACIQLSSDPTNTYPVFHNTCSFAVKYFWTPFKTPAGGYAEQNGILQPGETQTGAETAVGGYRVYACQTNYLVVGPDGSPITAVVSGFRCVKPGT